MTDALLERLAFTPGPQALTPLLWPSGLAPTPALTPGRPSGATLPSCDVLVVTWTAAEAEALADVLTPGVHRTSWMPYTHNWATFEPQLTWKSPAKEAKCLAAWWPTRIGTQKVLCVHSNLHLATDSADAPIVALWEQMIGECQPKLVITTGTAGGIGAATSLGDVFVCNSAKFNCTQAFKAKPWAQERFSNPCTISGTNLQLARTSLAQVNAERLPADLAPRNRTLNSAGIIIEISDNTGDVETVDYFAFADTDDSYGVVANDPQAHTEEMDDATLPLALSTMADPPAWLSVRNASDPQVPSSLGSLEKQKEWASQIYTKWGYWTTVGSAITCWALIADLQP